MAHKISIVDSLIGNNSINHNEGDIVFDNNTHEMKIAINDTIDTHSTLQQWQTGAWTTPEWMPVSGLDRGNVTVEMDSGGAVNYTVEHSYTTTNYPNAGDILVATDTGLSWSPSQFKVNVYSLFDNEIMYINEDGDIFVDGKRETNTSKIGMALLKAIDSKSTKKINSIDDLE